MKIKIWKKTQNRMIYAIKYTDSTKCLKVVFLTYYGPSYGIDHFINYYPKNVSGYDF